MEDRYRSELRVFSTLLSGGVLKLVSFKREEYSSYGVVIDGGVIDAGELLGSDYPSLKSVLSRLDLLEELCSGLKPHYSLSEIELLPPIPNPGRIICIGKNYRADIERLGLEIPEYPILFTRFPDSQVGHDQPLVKPKLSDKFDFEGEFTFVIGREGRHIKAEDAYHHIAGYSCYNDGSIRDYQRHTTQDAPGKNFWHSAAFGPWVITRDETTGPEEFEVISRVNGEEMQRAVANNLVFDVPAIVEYLSGIFPLVPGDVIATGTPAGVGLTRNPPVWLKDGDVVEVEIPQIGTLVNRVQSEAI